MSFLGLVTKKDLDFELTINSSTHAILKSEIKELQIIHKKQQESIRYLKDEISKLRRKCK